MSLIAEVVMSTYHGGGAPSQYLTSTRTVPNLGQVIGGGRPFNIIHISCLPRCLLDN